MNIGERCHHDLISEYRVDPATGRRRGIAPYIESVNSVWLKRVPLPFRGMLTAVANNYPGLPDPPWILEIVEERLGLAEVKQGAESLNQKYRGQLSRAQANLEQWLLNTTNKPRLSAIRSLTRKQQKEFSNQIQRQYEINPATGLPYPGGLSEGWIKMQDPHDSREEGETRAPFVVVEIAEMDTFWWEGILEPRDRSIENDQISFYNLSTFKEMRRLRNMRPGQNLLRWAV